MSKDWYSKLMKLEGAVDVNKDPTLSVLRSPSPYLNWAFGNKGHGLPRGYTMLLGGPPKAGKSLISYGMIGQMHKEDPEGWAVIFNTEFRGELQGNKESLALFGIDPKRIMIYNGNTPDLVFDRITKDLKALMDEGFPLRMIVIDSISNIRGRRAMNSDTVMQQQIGDQALTIQDGLINILPVIRQHEVGLILCTHVRAEMDPVEIMRGKKYKLQSAWAVKHHAEFFAMVERNEGKTGRETISGEKFENDNIKSVTGKEESTGHKIRFKVIDSSIGVNGRVGEFTLDFKRGFINQHEEVFLMGLNTGVIEKPNNMTYCFNGETWKGKDNMLIAIRDNPVLMNNIMQKVYELDIVGNSKQKEGEVYESKFQQE